MDSGSRPRPEMMVACELRRGIFPDGDALLLKQGLQLAGLEHLADDVAAADELAVDIELRDCGPVRERLDALTELVRLEHVQALIGDAEMIEDLHHLSRKPAHRKLRRSLHEQHDLITLDLVFDEFVDSHEFLIYRETRSARRLYSAPGASSQDPPPRLAITFCPVHRRCPHFEDVVLV